ncbi:hypothetical protein F5884DRAFT_781125 [Xylogone sp. PMI_703]|nr:hypothetical protein F5884DRAFT_781125 [Xylogone sp. PMI_703]
MKLRIQLRHCLCRSTIAWKWPLWISLFQSVSPSRILTMENPVQVPRKRGPKPKPLEERTYKPRDKPVTASRRSYPRHRKIEILQFLLHHRVPVIPSPNYQKPRYRPGIPPPSVPPGSDIEYRAVTLQEAADFWKVPMSTIQKWWTERDVIFAPKEKKERKNAAKRKKALRGMPPSEMPSHPLAPPAPQGLSGISPPSEPSLPAATTETSAPSASNTQPHSPQNDPPDVLNRSSS